MLIISQLLTLILIKDSVRSTTLLEVSPRNPVLKVGQNFTFKCSVATQLLYCRIQLPGKTSGYNLHENVPRKADYWYEGAGLKSGQCGITIARITEEQNGQFQCTMSTPTDDEEIVGSTNVTVARAPQDPPELMVSPEPGQNGVYREDTIIIARCSVKKARPKATLTWYIDDSKITDGVSRDEIIESPENLYTVNENLMFRPTWKDGTSKILRCEVNHITYDTPFSINKQISVGICPPISEECLTCMCEASTDCNFNELCRDGYCGLFLISHGFWLDGGMHTSNHSTLKGEEAWQTCARDPFCAAMSVRDYMKRYCKDCNADGKVDCTDFALIHQVGPSCHLTPSLGYAVFKRSLDNCMKEIIE